MSARPDHRAIHMGQQRRMRAYGLEPREEYDLQVVRRVLDTWHRGVPRPVAHPHAFEETGMCVECDAALLIQTLEDE